MIVRLNKSELKTLQALDPEAKGTRNWMKARDITAAVFRKKAENITPEEIRTVRNAFRKLTREELLEMGGVENRGQYRIAERGRKILNDEETEFESVYERGSATLAAKEQGEKRKGQWEKALSKREGKPSKPAPKRKPAAKAKAAAKPAKKAPPKEKAAKPAAPKEKKVEAKPAAKANNAPKTFKRKAPPPTVAEKQAEA
jgi:hypothetical protein